jgi:hypothetical protein
VKFGIIMDVEASRAIRQAEVGAAKTMIERTEQCFDIKPERLAADTAYGSAANLNWLVNEKRIAPHIPVIDKSKREEGSFSREDFTFYKEGNIYICPAFNITTGKIMTETRSSTEPAHAIALRAPSRGDAVRRSRSARSRAAFMSRPATWRERSPRLTPSSNPAVSANASRCCSRT